MKRAIHVFHNKGPMVNVQFWIVTPEIILAVDLDGNVTLPYDISMSERLVSWIHVTDQWEEWTND